MIFIKFDIINEIFSFIVLRILFIGKMFLVFRFRKSREDRIVLSYHIRRDQFKPGNTLKSFRIIKIRWLWSFHIFVNKKVGLNNKKKFTLFTLMNLKLPWKWHELKYVTIHIIANTHSFCWKKATTIKTDK